MIRRCIGLTISLCLLAIFPAKAAPYDEFLIHFDDLLKAYVSPAERHGISYLGVDYMAWHADDRHSVALDLLTDSNPAHFDTGSEKMAFWINAYNFLTIDLIVRENEREGIRNLGSWFQSPWKKYRWQIADKIYTLDQIEHEILRPMEDARIHFAIVCASLSCPDLRTGAYRTDTLDANLDDQVKLMLANTSKGMQIEGDTVHISKIFDWFEEDFADGRVRDWLRRYTAIGPDVRLRFLAYDWSLNSISGSP